MKPNLCGIVLSAVLILDAQALAASASPPRGQSAGSRANWKPGEVLVKFRAAADPLIASELEAAKLPMVRLPEAVRGLHRKGSISSLAPIGHPSLAGPRRKESLLQGIYALRLAGADTDIPALARELARDPAIEYAEPNYELTASFTPDDPFFASAGSWGQPYDDQWGLKLAQVPAAWDFVMGSNEIVVAVVDTGIDFLHPDLQGRIATNGWNFLNNSADPTDDSGHGTFCAGIIAAVVNNGLGMAGICPNAKILPVKFLDSTGHGYSSTAASAIDYAGQQGARIFSLSFSGIESYTLQIAIDGAYGNNSVLVASAGNKTNQVLDFPARYRKVITVGATDHADQLACFSNFGPRIDVVAPGGDSGMATNGYSILSLRATNTTPGIPLDDLYTRWRGTSFSAPFVAGVVALMRTHQPRLQNERIRQILRTTADDVLAPGWDLQSGYGRVNALAALQPTNAVITQITSPASFERAHGTIDITGTAYGIPFAWSVVEWGASWAPTHWTLLASNSVRIFNGYLATWDTSQVPDGDYTIRLRAADPDGNHFEDRVGFTIYNQLYNLDPPMHAGWPQPAGGANASAPLAADLDGDGKLELLWAVRHSMIVKYANGTDFPGWPRTLPGSARGPASVADLDGDGIPEIGLISDGDSFSQQNPDTIYLWRGDGTAVSGWPKTFEARNSFAVDNVSPVFADLNGDGLKEVIWCSAATNSGGEGFTTLVHVDRFDGTPLPGWPVLLPDEAERTFTPPALGDVDGDGRMDIVLLPFSDLVYLLGSGGQIMNGWPVRLSAFSDGLGGAPALVDIDHDGQLEIFAETYSGNLYLYKADGSRMPGWPQSIDGIAWPPAFGDLDGDGFPEIVVGVNGEDLGVFRRDGTRLPGWPPKYPALWFMPPVIADIDNDGHLDVASADRDGYVRAWNAAGEELYGMGFPVKATGICYSGPVLCDLTGTGVMNLIVLGNDNDHGSTYDIWDLGTPFDPARAPYPTMLGDNGHQSRFQVPPVIVSIAPAAAAANETTNITISGDAYLKGMRVLLAGTNQPVISETVTSIVFRLSTGVVPGRYPVQVSNLNSSATISTQALAIVSSWNADDDHDGLPNWWEFQHRTDPFDDGTLRPDNGPLGDPDRDGSFNLTEFRAGTDPQDPASVLALKGAEASPSGGLAISWNSVPGKTYSIYRAASITEPFLILTNGLPATPPLNSFVDDTPREAAAFYRIGVDYSSP